MASVLDKGLGVYKNIQAYGHANFAVAILKELDSTGVMSHAQILLEEQAYLDILFCFVPYALRLNGSPTAGTAQGHKHTEEYKAARSGPLNPEAIISIRNRKKSLPRHKCRDV